MMPNIRESQGHDDWGTMLGNLQICKDYQKCHGGFLYV